MGIFSNNTATSDSLATKVATSMQRWQCWRRQRHHRGRRCHHLRRLRRHQLMQKIALRLLLQAVLALERAAPSKECKQTGDIFRKLLRYFALTKLVTEKSNEIARGC